MTGLKYEEQGLDLFNNKLINLIKDYKDTFDNDDFTLYNYRIVLINSDFALNSDVNRDLLQDKLSEHNYYSTFEPCVYPGVNIKYYFNSLI